MASHPHAGPAHIAVLPGFARYLVERFTGPRAERIARRQNRAAAAQLQLMEPRLLADIGAAAAETMAEYQPLARLNPMVVAVNLYTTPRAGR